MESLTKMHSCVSIHMEDEFNPYAAPQTETPFLAAVGEGDQPEIWREGRFVIIPHGALLPPRCWRCNSPQIEGQWKCQLTWFPPVYLLLLLLGVLPLLIVLVFVQRRSTFSISLCPDHARRRRRHLLIAWAIALAGVACILFGALSLSMPRNDGQFIGIGVLALIVAAVYGGIMAGLASARRVDKYMARVTGAGRPFRDSLPDFTGHARTTGA